MFHSDCFAFVCLFFFLFRFNISDISACPISNIPMEWTSVVTGMQRCDSQQERRLLSLPWRLDRLSSDQPSGQRAVCLWWVSSLAVERRKLIEAVAWVRVWPVSIAAIASNIITKGSLIQLRPRLEEFPDWGHPPHRSKPNTSCS
jgi:hypothetical protein